MDKRKSKIKIIIIILAVLLSLSLAALAGTLIHSRLSEQSAVTAAVPDNIITQESNISSTTPLNSESAIQNNTDYTNIIDENSAVTIALHSKNAGDNIPFGVDNMFPGDAVTKYYCVKVSFKNTVNLRFHADIKNGYEKLAEVLNCKIILLTTGETLYDGLMRDMPASLVTTLSAQDTKTSELYYQITAYLDTSVGNEYRNKDLIADFRWWVEETNNLSKPETGDSTYFLLWIVLAIISFIVLNFLLFAEKRKKKGE